jgi:hypothetical protein
MSRDRPGFWQVVNPEADLDGVTALLVSAHLPNPLI